MQWSLFLLLLMGQCSFFMCHLHEYRFVKEKKNWTEAQQYCRDHDTDLATVSNMTDMERLQRLLESAHDKDEAWIGLYRRSKQSYPMGAGRTAGEDNRMWHWSLPGVEFNDDEKTKWAPGEPDNTPYSENCVCIHNNVWRDFHCTMRMPAFICYDERKQSNKTFHLIEDTMSWPQAQNYCREHHTDLVSGDQQLEDDEFKREYNSDKWMWIGLFRDSWRWSDGSNSSFRYWDLESVNNYHHNKCAMLNNNNNKKKKKNGKWRADRCNHKKPFFCYNGTTTKKGTTAGPSSSTVTEDETQEPTTKKGTTAGPSSSTVTEDETQGTTTKKGTTAGPSSSTVTEDKTQDKMILINKNMTWEDALYYCEEKHHDLVYITNLNEQRWVQEKAKKANSPYVWLGLRYTCTLGFWFWIDDKMVTYKNWDTDVPADDCDMSGAMDRGGEHKWFKKNDNEKFNFICSRC